MSKKKGVLDQSAQELNETKGRLARALADYDNLRKRVEEQGIVQERIRISHIIARFLPVLDMLIQAQTHITDSGLALITKEFKDALLASGAQEIQVNTGDDFDPTFEEAVEILEHQDEGCNNKIAEVLASGWKMKGEPLVVIRPAKVKVYKV